MSQIPENMEKFIHLVVEDIMQEGIDDKYLFKAIFSGGGPGAGKSFITKKMFGGEMISRVDSDALFTYLLKKSGMSQKLQMDKPEYQEKRNIAKQQITSKLQNLINGFLPILIDGTGRDLNKVKTQKELLEQLGYDTYMVFVNTDLKTSLQRNKTRERTIEPELVTQMWNQVQKNIGAFQDLFGNNLIIIDNSNTKDKSDSNIANKLSRTAQKILSAPLQNHIGVAKLKTAKERGRATMTDVTPDDRKSLIRKLKV